MVPLKRVRESWGEYKTPNRWRFDVGEYWFYLSAVIGRKQGKKRRIIRKDLRLNLDWRFYNEAGSRVESD